MDLVVVVPGDPQPKGSKHLAKRGKSVWMLDGGSGKAHRQLKDWTFMVRTYTAATMRAKALCEAVDGPLAADLTFYLQRPKSAAKRLHCAVKPDLDKLVRGAIDPLVGLAITEDSRIVSLSARKVYADSDNPPGAFIHVWSV